MSRFLNPQTLMGKGITISQKDQNLAVCIAMDSTLYRAGIQPLIGEALTLGFCYAVTEHSEKFS